MSLDDGRSWEGSGGDLPWDSPDESWEPADTEAWRAAASKARSGLSGGRRVATRYLLVRISHMKHGNNLN